MGKTEPVAVHSDEVQAQLVRELYERNRSSIVILLVIIVMFRWAMGVAYIIDGVIRGLFVLLIVVCVIRWVLVMIPTARRDAVASIRTQYLAFAIGVIVTSLTFSALILRAWPILDTPHLAIVAATVAGITSGAIMSLGSSLFVYIVYMVPTVSTLFFMTATDSRPPWGAKLLAASIVLYAATVIAMGIDHSRTRRRGIQLRLKLSDLVLRDTLTDLRNRRFLQEYMTVESGRLAREATNTERAQKTEHEAAIAIYMMDLDHFKLVNDSHGHDAGDQVLKQLSAILTASVRKSDILVRWGGEEFALVARIKQREHARILAENLRYRIETTEFVLPSGSTLRRTCSFGFCVLPFFPDRPRTLNWEQALGLADAALYIAKQEGRNRWVGVACGKEPWQDGPEAYLDVRSNLMRAAQLGKVLLDRSNEGSAGVVPGSS